ncbi:MAG: FKBP-type peptidyl-prolyl cis-trans isomerase [Saprospiraceae bacterium]|jgi:FKBP-type peptidyl-prolyl cis-trans isomerase SlyD
MQIENNKVVTVHYRLQDENADGELIETTLGSDPLVFLYGVGQMIPEFERQLLGKSSGDALSFRIEAADAYGEFDEDALVELPMDVFLIDGELAEDLLEIGKQIPMSDQNGNRLVGTVDEIREDSVLMDFNHPMAGVNLFFEVSVQSVRDATQEELDHGHVHGPGGHQH